MKRTRLRIILALSLCVFIGGGHFSWAQESSLNNYTPPPLFGAPTQQKKIPYVSPVKKPPAPQKAVKIETTPVPKPKPKSVIKPQEIVIKKEKNKEEKLDKPRLAITPSTILPDPPPTLEPIHLRTKKIQPTGVVKGPKTMPAVKKSNVDTETLFQPENSQPTGLIDRVQEQKKEQEKKDRIAIVAPPPSLEVEQDILLERLKDNTQKMLLPFSPAVSEVNSSQKFALQKILLEMDKNINSKIQIKSFASPQGGEESSDRRIALSRALEIRYFFLSQGVDARRIKLRALGGQTTVTPMDRVEIYLVSK